MRRFTSAALVLCASLVLAPPALATHGNTDPDGHWLEYVHITEVTFEKVGRLGDIGNPMIGVWITCDAVGRISDLTIDLEQRMRRASTNWSGTNSDLLEARCSPTPTRYQLNLYVRDDVPFRPGVATITHVSEGGIGPWPTGQKIVLRGA